MAYDGVFITGTDTGVGKTFVSALLLRALIKRGVDAGYVKSAATGVVDGECEDVSFVLKYGGVSGDLKDLCPVLLRIPASPYASALAENVSVDVGAILNAVKRARSARRFVVAEGVGGLLVPLTHDRTVLDLISQLALPVLVVSRPGLGTVNHSLLTLDKLKTSGIPVLGFVTCGASDSSDPTIPSNPALIEQFSQTPFLGHIPYCEDPERDFPAWTAYLDQTVTRLGF